MLKYMTVATMATIFFGSLIACGDKDDDTASDTSVVEETDQEAPETGDTGEEAQESE